MASEQLKTKSAETFLQVLCDEKSSVGEKYRAIFELRSIGTAESIDCLIKGFPSLHPSELLKHEVTYALGQMKPTDKMVQFLSERLQDEGEQIVVRHESGEALANFGREDLLDLLSKYQNCGIQEIEDTCTLAVVKLKNFSAQKQLYGLKFSGTIEPAAPFTRDEMEAHLKSAEIKDSPDLLSRVEEFLLSQKVDIFLKYRAMYFLRECETKDSIEILKNLLKAENRDKTRVLLRHEVCFIFGQLSEKAVGALDVLRQVIEDKSENEIVRHEAISGYSSMTDDTEILKKYALDESRIVKESCEVALDMIEYWKN